MSALYKDIQTELLIRGYIRNIRYLQLSIPDTLKKLCISFYGVIVLEKYKIVILGGENEGGTNKHDIFDDSLRDKHTQDIELMKPVTVDYKTCWLDIFIPGEPIQELFSSKTDNHGRCADLFVIVYSITSKESFDQAIINRGRILFEMHSEKPFILVGNNIELSEQRKIPKDEGQNLSLEWGENSSFFEISTKDRSNCDECIVGIVQTLRRLNDALNEIEKVKNSSCCIVL